MIWLTDRERAALAMLVALAVAAVGVLAWQRRGVPVRVVPGPTPPYAQWDRLLKEAQTVDLNRAGTAQLEQLPEIGPSLAERIVAYRTAHGPFVRLEDLEQVPGIGPKTLESLKDYVTVNE